jgi:hypothetical protein
MSALKMTKIQTLTMYVFLPVSTMAKCICHGTRAYKATEYTLHHSRNTEGKDETIQETLTAVLTGAMTLATLYVSKQTEQDAFPERQSRVSRYSV